MNESLALGPIGQISRRVSKIEVAVAWYGEKLGLPHLFTFGKIAFFDCDGTRLFLTEPEDASAPGEQSILYFQVEDIATAQSTLQERGVTFRQEARLIHRHENGVEEWMAFFEDPDGGILALMSQTPPAA